MSRENWAGVTEEDYQPEEETQGKVWMLGCSAQVHSHSKCYARGSQETTTGSRHPVL